MTLETLPVGTESFSESESRCSDAKDEIDCIGSLESTPLLKVSTSKYESPSTKTARSPIFPKINDMPRYYDIKIFDVKLNAKLQGMEISDLVEQTIATWSVERPDLDFTAMSTALKVNLLVTKQLELTNQHMLELGVTLGEFDVLATLRRHGKNGVLMPTEIAVFAMITPSGLTNRLSRLEKMGHIVRLSDPNDRRISLVRITAKGRRIADLGIEFAAHHSADILDGVKPADLAAFTRVINQLILNIEDQKPSTASTLRSLRHRHRR